MENKDYSKNHLNSKDHINSQINIDIQTLYNQIEKLKLNINKKEDDLKNIINEKDNVIQQLNEKILNQERRIDYNENEIKKINGKILTQESRMINNENEIKILNNKINELNKKNEDKFKEKENIINKINNTIINQEKELTKIIRSHEEKNEIHFGQLPYFYNNQRIMQEFEHLKDLEREYGFLNSIQTKLLVPGRINEIEGFMKAPDNSPYKDGIFNFIIKYPDNYPDIGPELILKTKIFHCNASIYGQCCISHLRSSMWNNNYDISMVLCFLYEFFIRNNPDSPLRYDLAKLYKENYHLFLEKCQNFVNQYAFHQFNERLNYIFPDYSNTKLKFSNSNFIFIVNSKSITVPKDKIQDKNFDLENYLGTDLKDKAFIIGNKVFNSMIELKDYLSYHIIYVIPRIKT